MNAVTAEFKVRHYCRRQSELKKKNIYPRALNPTLNTVLWRTRACKVQAWPEMPVKKMELLERASMHVFSVECITTWKESGSASSMTNFEFCRDRPHSMELPTLVLMYSCCNWQRYLILPSILLSFFFFSASFRFAFIIFNEFVPQAFLFDKSSCLLQRGRKPWPWLRPATPASRRLSSTLLLPSASVVRRLPPRPRRWQARRNLQQRK